GSSLEGEIMRQIGKAGALVAGMLVFGGIGFAQCKIAVVDMQDAVVGSNEGKAQSAKFDAKVADWKKKIDQINTELEGAQNKLKTTQSLASQSVIAGLNKNISDKQTELQRKTEDAQKEVNDFREQLLSPVMMT